MSEPSSGEACRCGEGLEWTGHAAIPVLATGLWITARDCVCFLLLCEEKEEEEAAIGGGNPGYPSLSLCRAVC